MAEVIRIKKGLDIKLKGKVAVDGYDREAVLPELFSVCPDDFHGVKPKVVVNEGDRVKVGSVLFFDKNNPDVKFVSPASGEVVSVNRGERRKLLNVLIKSDGSFESEPFTKADPKDLSAEEVRGLLLNGGFWPFIKQRPYDVVANPNDKPKAIFISGFDSAPLAPNYDFTLDGMKNELQLGVNALAKLTDGKVHIGIHKDNASKVFKEVRGAEVHVFDGPHPAGNVGVQIHHIDPINKGEVVWVVNPHDVVAIGKAFSKGVISFERPVVLVGSEVIKPLYYKSYFGASISNMVKGNVKEGANVRYISGNPLTGKQIAADGFVGAYDSQITVLPEGDHYEFLGWIMPRLAKFSVSKSYLSWLMGGSKEYALDTNINGGERAFIMSGEYDKVFPMDILPEFLVKAILSKNIEEMENLGIYEVAPEDFALCEFVCTSKIETQKIVREGLDYLRKELA